MVEATSDVSSEIAVCIGRKYMGGAECFSAVLEGGVVYEKMCRFIFMVLY